MSKFILLKTDSSRKSYFDLNEEKTKLDDFEVIKKIGDGVYSKVFLV